MKVAVVGGGINGVMSAWALALEGCSVDLFERGELMGETSSASTKLLHGGLRYLEQGHFRLVREALRERRWWMTRAPHLAKPLQIQLPVYEHSGRPKWMISCGLALYEFLAGSSAIGPWRWHRRDEMLHAYSELRAEGLQGGFSFYDGQIDDRALGLWAAEQAAKAGVRLQIRTQVDSISPDGSVTIGGVLHDYNKIVNAAGPWARQLLDASNIAARHDLDLVRGSHLLLEEERRGAFLLQSPRNGRFCFVLPYFGKTLVGTTEVRQAITDPIRCSAEERSDLLELHHHYFPSISATVTDEISGLRPLIRSHADPNKATREYAIEQSGKVVSIFGGKWTTSRALGLKVARAVMQ